MSIVNSCHVMLYCAPRRAAICDGDDPSNADVSFWLRNAVTAATDHDPASPSSPPTFFSLIPSPYHHHLITIESIPN